MKCVVVTLFYSYHTPVGASRKSLGLKPKSRARPLRHSCVCSESGGPAFFINKNQAHFTEATCFPRETLLPPASPELQRGESALMDFTPQRKRSRGMLLCLPRTKRAPLQIIQRGLPTFPGKPSIIGLGVFHFRVRNGNGWDNASIAPIE
jgi:hypothetical protein